ncbi:MAG TPA: hypothetical protein VMW24_06570 [Sedimentisphaerales bacterium]|nr:hypothetical protein [Sedimentisphaerales bacterium]
MGMKDKTFSSLLQWAKRKGIKYLLGSNNPGIGVQPLQVTGGGTGTDTVTLASTYFNGHVLQNMANTSYLVLMGFSASPAGTSIGTKATGSFVVTGLALNETLDLAVVGTIEGMPDFT